MSGASVEMSGEDQPEGAYKYFQKQAKEMSDAQRKAYKKASGQLGDWYQEAIGFQQPTYDQGIAASNLMGAYSGALGQQAQKEAFDNYQMSPDVQWAMQQGLKGIDQNAAANRELLGGNRLQDVQTYGS